MARVSFTQNLQRHVACPPCTAEGATLRAVLDAAFATNPKARGYVLDDRGELRHHMVVFIDGEMLRDRVSLTDPVRPDSEVYVMQALSGG
jgi:hypothetical protein